MNNETVSGPEADMADSTVSEPHRNGTNYPATRAPIADEFRCVRIMDEETGERCRLAAIRGGSVCHKHGGAAPQVRAAANERLAEQALAREIQRLLPEMDASPVKDAEGLLREITGAQRALATAHARVAAETTDPEERARAQDGLRALLRDAHASSVSLMQHGTPPDLEDDGVDGFVKLATLMDAMEANRDANMVRCPSCHGDGYLPRWTVVAGEVESGEPEPTANDLL